MTTDPVVHQVANDPSVGIWIRYMLHGFAVAARILASVAWPLVVLLLLRKVKLSDLNSLLVNRDLAAIFGNFKVTATVPAAGAEKAPSPENEKETGLKERDARPKMMKEVPLSETAARIAPMIPEKSVMAGAPAPGTAITVNRAALLGKPGSVYYFAHDLMLCYIAATDNSPLGIIIHTAKQARHHLGQIGFGDTPFMAQLSGFIKESEAGGEALWTQEYRKAAAADLWRISRTVGDIIVQMQPVK